jgi:toxin ParE1/3/4
MKLRYSPSSLADLESILHYISARSPQGAIKVKGRIRAIIDMIAMHPFTGTRTNDPAIRRFATSPYPYLIFYEITDAEIIIRYIRHDARNPDTMPRA